MRAVELMSLSYDCSHIEKLFHTGRLPDKTPWNTAIFKIYNIEGYCGRRGSIYLVALLPV